MPRHREKCSHLVLALFLFLLSGDCVRGECQVPTVESGYELSDESLALNSYPDGTKVTLQCATGYIRKGGNGNIICEAGKWTTATLLCEKKSCGSPEELLNGQFSIPEGVEFGATIYASCNTGYTLIGPTFQQCYDFGWSNNLPVCEIVKCEDPPEIRNGRITTHLNKEFPEFRDIIEYACDQNYNLVGDSQIVCNEFGKYNGTIPSCKDLSCPTPEIPNARRTEGGPPPYKLKYYVVYECKKGYEMHGESKLVCEEHGWSSEFPQCIPVATTKTTTTQKPKTTTPVTTTKTTTTQKPKTTTPGAFSSLVPW